MKNYDKENIKESTVTKVGKIFSSGRFTLEAATSASSCLVGIYKWADAMMQYHELLKIVNPKREKVKEMNAKLAIVRKSLAEKRAQLKEVQDKIDKLDREYKEKVAFEASLQAQIDDSMLKLSRANKIIQGLQGEKDRWVEQVAIYTEDIGYLIGNCLIGAGMVAYGGPFTAQFRTSLESFWRDEATKRGLKLREGISMKVLLEDPVTTKMWTAASLPNDNLSIENAIIMFGSRRWPMMIDPQN
jgi:dynein heavy chain